ncbi:MAG TPA: pirin family protein [Nocardioidaceae bacterium]|nr:pirin family protein [Nocardioidaceae bacterium]
MSTFETVHEPLEARDVLLGRTTHVRRILPNKSRRMIGAWCFLDHYGPDDIKATGGMWVPPHPHTGLQTVTWLFEGLGLHTDSLGTRQTIRPGQLNVMTAGHGIAHAEISPPEAPTTLHGLQMWVCLPDAVRETATPDLTHLADLPGFEEPGVGVRVLTGSLAGATSPAPAYSPLMAAEITLAPGGSVTLPLERDFEYGVLTAQGSLRVDGREVTRNAMSYLGEGRPELTLSATGTTAGDGAAGDTVVMLLGGAPFEEQIVMWWNFIGRTHEEIVAQREDWNGDAVAYRPERYGTVEGFDGPRLLAPPMPTTRLKPRPRAV